jgi:hypothetical protein
MVRPSLTGWFRRKGCWLSLTELGFGGKVAGLGEICRQSSGIFGGKAPRPSGLDDCLVLGLPFCLDRKEGSS